MLYWRQILTVILVIFRCNMDSACTFFGNRDASSDIIPSLRKIIFTLIKYKKVKRFYVGNQGQFDSITISVLTELEQEYDIHFSIVLAYLPQVQAPLLDMSHTILPSGLESVHPRYAIDRRNRWMLDQCDYVVTYVRNPVGGAAKFKEIAFKRGKTVIEINQN